MLTMLDWKSPLLTIRVKCSKGAYIRAMARDIGNTLGTGGYIKSLRRTQIGPYHVENALTLSDIKEKSLVNESIPVH